MQTILKKTNDSFKKFHTKDKEPISRRLLAIKYTPATLDSYPCSHLLITIIITTPTIKYGANLKNVIINHPP
tara:strand:+ start:486 stop:701 length:216 start_codon:yes stop_codon:yes gene_type:complete